MRMDDVEAFLAVCKYTSFSKAAKNLFTTQPGISQQITSLEEEFGKTFFIRGKGIQKVTLTDEGRVFYEAAKQFKILYNNTKAIVATQNMSHFYFGCVRSLSTIMFPSVFKNFHQQYTNTLLHLIADESTVLREQITSNLLDCALVCSAPPSTQLRIVPFAAEPFVFVCRKDSPYPKDLVNIQELNVQNEIYVQWNPEFEAWHNSIFSTHEPTLINLRMPSNLEEFFISPDIWSIVPVSFIESMGENFHIIPINDILPNRFFYFISHYDTNKIFYEYIYRILWEELNKIKGIKMLAQLDTF